MNFERYTDPLQSIGIGKKAQIEQWLKEMGVTDWSLNKDLSIDVNGSIDLSGKGLTEIPSFIQFGYVGGSFWCMNNQLTSLRGAPIRVKWGFYLKNNKPRFSEEDIEKICQIGGYIYV